MSLTALLFCLAIESAAQEGQLLTPTEARRLEKESTANYAEIRLRVVDSNSLASLTSKSSSYTKLVNELANAKKLGALEKLDWAQFSLDNSVVVPFAPKRNTRASEIFSQVSVNRLTMQIAYGVEPIARKPLPSALQNLDKVLPGQRMTFALPGATKSSPYLKNKQLESIEYKLLQSQSNYSNKILERAGIEGAESSVRFLVPSEPLTPTAPVISTLLRIPCADLSKFVDLLKTPGAELKASPCEAEAPELSLMTIDMSPAKLRLSASPPTEQVTSDTFPGLASLSPQAAGENGGTELQLSSTAQSNGWNQAVPDSATLTRVAAVLKSPFPASAPTPILVVVDDGFPSQEAYEQTREFFLSAEQLLQEKYAIEAEWLVPPTDDASKMGIRSELSKFPVNTAAPRNLSKCVSLTSDSCTFHAKSIEKALRPFTSLVNGTQPVKIVWVPLFMAQPGSPHLTWLIHRFHRIVPDEFSAERRKFSAELLSEITADYFHMVSRRGLGYPEISSDWQISRPYFNAILSYFRAYSAQTNTPVFVNLSWRTDSNESSTFSGRGNSRVILVAAAGNPCLENVSCASATAEDEKIGRYNFLRHGLYRDPSSTYVVANVDASGKAICATARLKFSESAFAFPGGIETDCGTSFSAPRVAWLLAANERFTTRVQADADLWADALRRRIGSGRNEKECSLESDNMKCLIPKLEVIFPGLGRPIK